MNRQLNATLELEKDEKIRYQKKCFNNPKINDHGQMLNENHLIEKQIRNLVPGQLIMFGRLETSDGQSKNHLVVKTSGIVRWTSHVENFVWNNLGNEILSSSSLSGEKGLNGKSECSTKLITLFIVCLP
jgi:hypothetical protein